VFIKSVAIVQGREPALRAAVHAEALDDHRQGKGRFRTVVVRRLLAGTNVTATVKGHLVAIASAPKGTATLRFRARKGKLAHHGLAAGRPAEQRHALAPLRTAFGRL